MDYQSAKRQIIVKRTLGTAVFVLAALFCAVGFLLFVYHSMDGGGAELSGLSVQAKRLVYAIFKRTQFLLPIWNAAPTPNLREPTSSGTIGFLACYFAMFFGASLVGSGNRLSRRLRTIDRQIEDEAIRESVKGRSPRSRKDVEQHINVSKQPVWKEIHTLYVAPLIVGIILWAVGKFIS